MSSHKKITKVPNGPLIKKKGPFKGSTLKKGGVIKKAQSGKYITKEDDKYTVTRKIKTKGGPRYYQGVSPNMSFADELALNKSITKPADSIPKSKLTPRALEMMNQKNGGAIKKAQAGKRVTRYMTDEEYKKETDSLSKRFRKIDPGFSISPKGSGKNTDPGFTKTPENYNPNIKRRRVTSEDGVLQYLKNGNKIKKAKAGGMIKRADGSYSRRGLWDNIRANKGSGKKPTKQMLQQEKKIKAKSKK